MLIGILMIGLFVFLLYLINCFADVKTERKKIMFGMLFAIALIIFMFYFLSIYQNPVQTIRNLHH